MNKDEKIFYGLIILVFVIVLIVFWHPWINDSTANSAFEEYYGEVVSNLYDVKITGWHPFGNYFEVRTEEKNILVGKGMINLFGGVMDFEFVWE